MTLSAEFMKAIRKLNAKGITPLLAKTGDLCDQDTGEILLLRLKSGKYINPGEYKGENQND